MSIITDAHAPRWATLPEAAEYLSCSPRTVRRHIDAGVLTGYRYAGRWRLDLDQIDAAVRAGKITTGGVDQ